MCDGLAPLVAFSKQLSEPSNPRRNFAAVMTCADADIACPVVEGADVRVALPYVDPKRADGTVHEHSIYEASAQEIARELLYLVAGV